MDYNPNSTDEVDYDSSLTTTEFNVLIARYKRSVYENLYCILSEEDVSEIPQPQVASRDDLPDLHSLSTHT